MHARPPIPKLLDAARKRTQRDQSLAADPAASVWVSANAGTGKTHVLTQRVLRILLTGTKPERVLCLTYTKAAAAEMSKRVFEVLGEWVIDTEAALGERLAELLGRTALPDETLRARVLFAEAIETPGGLKVQTIHAFCERLLQRFPLEAGVAPHFTILEEETSRALQRIAIDEVLQLATADPAGDLGMALGCVIAYAAEDGFDQVIRQALGAHQSLAALIRAGREETDPFEGVEAELRAALGVGKARTAADIERELATLIAPADLARAIGVLSEGSKTDIALAEDLKRVRASQDQALRAAAVETALLTKEKAAKLRFFTKTLQDQNGDLYARLLTAQARAERAVGERQSLVLIEATVALLRLADAILQRYQVHKSRRAALDFDDLIEKTAGLLSASTSAEWVLYKLDGGLDHILVDESQDTAPVQWRVIEALAAEFFSGEGAREEPRTIFAVGDEKQSIYSFQGAEPAMFARMGKAFERRAAAALMPWQRIPLDLSFRSVAPVLAAVDKVFSHAEAARGLSATGKTAAHIANRAGEAGLIEVWPTEVADAAGVADPFAPNAEPASEAPASRLAERIARTIRHWLDSGERLSSQDRPIGAGDVLILVRKRRPFAGPMVRALKARGIPVAGADRIQLTEQIAVQDLIALGEFLVLPEDDLSLAAVLKSPLFGLTDDDLFAIAHERRGSLWSALLKRGSADLAFAAPAQTLKRWRARADYVPPYEFFAGLLDQKSAELTYRQHMLARLGPEAAEPIDEFLNLALNYDDSAPPSLQGFLTAVRRDAREIKRDMDQGRDEVRVMTVHGAKGLEAPIVFLPDTCTTRSGRTPGSLLPLAALARQSSPPPLVWPVKGTGKLDVIRAARAGLDAAEAEEYHRLLYVAMTRPRDRLYVAGFEGAKGRAPGCWYDLIWQALADDLDAVALGDGRTVWRKASEQQQPARTKPERPHAAASIARLPEWARHPAPAIPTRSIPLVPSRLAPLESEDDADESARRPPNSAPPSVPHPGPAADPTALGPSHRVEAHRFLRGTLTHALLEHLPSFAPARWKTVADAFLAHRARGLSAHVRASIVAETLAILEDSRFAPYFGRDSRPEVPIVAEIPAPSGNGPPLRIIGQIDRLTVFERPEGREALIIDYKTNRPPPQEPAKVARSYLLQLAAYRLAVRAALAAKTVRAAILWTDGPRMMEIPAAILDVHEGALWHSDQLRGT